jgi:predicted oxidoreductase
VPLADTWAAMERLVEAGLVRHIGVCNFGVALVRDLLASARVRPAVLAEAVRRSLGNDRGIIALSGLRACPGSSLPPTCWCSGSSSSRR